MHWKAKSVQRCLFPSSSSLPFWGQYQIKGVATGSAYPVCILYLCSPEEQNDYFLIVLLFYVVQWKQCIWFCLLVGLLVWCLQSVNRSKRAILKTLGEEDLLSTENYFFILYINQYYNYLVSSFCPKKKKKKTNQIFGCFPKSKLQTIQASSLANFILSQHFSIIIFSVLMLQEAKALWYFDVSKGFEVLVSYYCLPFTLYSQPNYLLYSSLWNTAQALTDSLSYQEQKGIENQGRGESEN